MPDSFMILPMRAYSRSLLIGLVALAVAIGGAGQAPVFRLDCARAHDQHAMHEHGAAEMQEHGAPQDQQQHASLNCCVPCNAASNAAPVAPNAAMELILSSILYPLGEDLVPGRSVVVDPGIPKQGI
jgi:hypothetical protein